MKSVLQGGVMKGLIKSTMFNTAAVVLLSVMVTLPVFAETETAALSDKKSTTEAATTQIQKTASDTEKKPSKRLRFRDGPVCMCADGITENDILASQKRNKEKLKIIENNEGRKP